MSLNHLPDLYRRIPKVELHRHLEGSLRPETLAELASEHQIVLSQSDQIKRQVQMGTGELKNMVNFLSKFQIIRQFFLSPHVIARITEEAIEDAAGDGIRYMEMFFTPVALSRLQGYPMGDVMDWVAEAAYKASQRSGIETRLITSVNRHESVKLAEEVARLTIERKKLGILGLNLAGNEADFPAGPFVPVFREVKEAGMAVSIHAGEWSGPENVREALVDLQADRIGHGIRVLDDPLVVALAKESGKAFEVCISSNHQTGVVPNLAKHPLKTMLDAGLNVTLNTDDPSIFRITLSSEYSLAVNQIGVPHATLARMIINAARASFLPAQEKEGLVRSLLDDPTLKEMMAS